MRMAASFIVGVAVLLAQAPAVEVVRVVSKQLERNVRLPGEILPYQQVAIHPRVSGFVESVEVDRGSMVKKDQALARLVAPELATQRAEAEAKVEAIEAQRLEAEAKLRGDQAAYERLKTASATPGVVSGNELDLAEKALEAGRARVRSLENSSKAARAAVDTIRETEKYLQVTAPFDGVITQRKAHPGALAGPNSREPMFQLEQVSRLRLVVSVPELDLSGIAHGAKVSFTVPAYPGETFSGIVSRAARSMDTATRSMPVELDVENRDARLAPGMFPEVTWPVRRARPSLLVPPSGVAVTTERTFVVRIRQGVAEWVNVSRGAAAGGLVEVFGALKAGDVVARRGTDELREGTRVTVKEN